MAIHPVPFATSQGKIVSLAETRHWGGGDPKTPAPGTQWGSAPQQLWQNGVGEPDWDRVVKLCQGPKAITPHNHFCQEKNGFRCGLEMWRDKLTQISGHGVGAAPSPPFGEAAEVQWWESAANVLGFFLGGGGCKYHLLRPGQEVVTTPPGDKPHLGGGGKPPSL